MLRLGRITASSVKPGVWPIVIIEAGTSLNGNIYPPHVLRAAAEAGVFEAVPVAAYRKIDASGHPIEDHIARDFSGMGARNVVGATRSTRWSESEQAVVGELHLSLGKAEADAYEADLRAHAQNGNLDIPGLSIDALALLSESGAVEQIEQCLELTIVTHPSAGGRFATHRIAASVQNPEGATVFEKTLKRLREGYGGIVGPYLGPESEGALERHIARRLSESEDVRAKAIAALVEGKSRHPKLEQAIGDPAARLVEGVDLMACLDDAAALIAMAKAELEAEAPVEEPAEEPAEEAAPERTEESDEAQPEPTAEAPVAEEPTAEAPADEPAPEASSEPTQADKDAEYLARRAAEERARESEQNIREACKAAKLSDSIADQLINQTKGGFVDAETATTLAQNQRAIIDGAIRESHQGGNMEIVRESQDRLTEALAHLFNPANCPKPTEGAYAHQSFRAFVEDKFLDRKHRISEAATGGQTARRRIAEAVDSTQFDQVFADALDRALLGAYQGHANYSAWQKVVRRVSYSDFRTHRIVNVGYYGSLPTVAKSGSYLQLTTPSDREETIALAKKGGLESITFEDMLNDDLSLWQTMIQRLGQAAMETRFESVFSLLRDAGQPTMTDSYTLTSQSRSPVNEGTAALSADATGKTNFINSVTAMMSGTGGSGKKKGVVPAFIVIPFAKVEAWAYVWNALTGGNTGTDTNVALMNVLGIGMPEAIIDYGTSNTTDWYLLANPNEAEVFRFAELGGREGPEIFVADDGRFGALFTNDQIELKIRDVHACAAVDYLGVYGNDAAS